MVKCTPINFFYVKLGKINKPSSSQNQFKGKFFQGKLNVGNARWSHEQEAEKGIQQVVQKLYRFVEGQDSTFNSGLPDQAAQTTFFRPNKQEDTNKMLNVKKRGERSSPQICGAGCRNKEKQKAKLEQ